MKKIFMIMLLFVATTTVNANGNGNNTPSTHGCKDVNNDGLCDTTNVPIQKFCQDIANPPVNHDDDPTNDIDRSESRARHAGCMISIAKTHR